MYNLNRNLNRNINYINYNELLENVISNMNQIYKMYYGDIIIYHNNISDDE